MTRRPVGRQRGFTLIEVMVAVMLMAIVSLIAWRGLDSVSRTDAHLKASGEDQARLLRALNQLARDIDLRATTELDQPPLPGLGETQRPREAVMSVRSQGGRMDLIRTSPRQDGTLQSVRWWLKGGTLYRAASAPQTRLPLPGPKAGVAVLDGVRTVQWRAWQPGKGWKPISGEEVNPRGLELTLSRMTDQGIEQYRHVFGPLN
jgi:general secretion pathway protein J